MRLGRHEVRILKWLYERPAWHYTDRIAQALVPDYYRHTPREWVSLKLRQLREKGFIKDKRVDQMKFWSITEEGIEEIHRRDK